MHWWRKLNIAIFDGKLDPPLSVTCKNFHSRVLGWCQASFEGSPDVHMGIKQTLYTRKLFLTVLVHEMVHQWEQKFRRNMSHGKYFKLWRPVISDALGLTLDKIVNVKEILNI